MPGNYNRSDSIVNVKHGERALHFLHHCIGEGIVFARAIECQQDYGRGCWRGGRDVGDADVLEGELCVGGREGDGGWWWRHWEGWLLGTVGLWAR